MGDWDLFYSWDCNGSYGQTTWKLDNDGTFTSGTGGSGVWSQVSGMITLIYNVGAKPSYAGNILGSSITGMMLTEDGQYSGCWYALKQGTSGVTAERSRFNDSGK